MVVNEGLKSRVFRVQGCDWVHAKVGQGGACVTFVWVLGETVAEGREGGGETITAALARERGCQLGNIRNLLGR